MTNTTQSPAGGDGCPHLKIQYCPLYVAAHDARLGISCDDGRLHEGGCAVDRGMGYAAQVTRLNLAAPQMVAILRFNEENDARNAQRARNMRSAGIQ